MVTILKNFTIISPPKIIKNGTVIVSEEGKLTYVGNSKSAPNINGQIINGKGKIVSPGFIDIHVHGGIGVTFGDGDLFQDLSRYSKWVAASGVTGFLCSVAGADAQTTNRIIREYVGIIERGLPGAEVLGLHLEGPFLNPQKKGAFNPAWLRSPSVAETDEYIKSGKGWIKQMTLAPELPEAMQVAAALRKAGVVVALGHSNTDYEFAHAALKGDYTHVTHTFNAQSSFNHRAPGVIGAVLASDSVSAELIADTIHVHPGAMKVIYRCLGSERIVLITDAMPGAGLPDGIYEMIGEKVTVKDGKATLDDGTIAGSTAQLNQCVRNMHKLVGVPLQHAIRMATLNPARVVGESAVIGSLEPGKWANLIVIDEDVNVYLSMIKGNIVNSSL